MTQKALRNVARETLAKACKGEAVSLKAIQAATLALHAPPFKGE